MHRAVALPAPDVRTGEASAKYARAAPSHHGTGVFSFVAYGSEARGGSYGQVLLLLRARKARDGPGSPLHEVAYIKPWKELGVDDITGCVKLEAIGDAEACVIVPVAHLRRVEHIVRSDIDEVKFGMGTGGGDLEAELAEIGAQLEAVAAVRDDLRAAVQRMDGLTRQLQSDLLGVHRRQEGAVQQAVQKARESVPKLQAAYAELAAIIARRPGEFYRFSDHWRSQNHTVVSQLAFAHWLDSGTLLSHKQLEEQLQLPAASFSIDLEDYLTGLCGLSNEFPRFVMNRVTAGDYAVPRVAAAFLNDLFAAFRKLNLRNDMLRKRFDGIKYDLKKVEEVVYDVEIRGLARTAAEPMQDA
ncbi:unnamed protein product [Closterium sp. Yama58-4]|nr:unnamed protein product [Closterium sp. Yama58-4]